MPASTYQHIRHGFEITRHHFKGVYIWRSHRKSKTTPSSIVCTLEEGLTEDIGESAGVEDDDHGRGEYEPITFSCRGTYATLRPWNPNMCFLAAAIHKKWLRFPLGLGSCVFTVDCSLLTLSHIADIVGPGGRVIGVFSETYAEKPSQAEREKFLRRRPHVSIVDEDPQKASVDRYKQMLGIADPAKRSFEMAFDQCLREATPSLDSQVRTEEPGVTEKLAKRVFDFLEPDVPEVDCLIFGSWPFGIRAEMIRDIIVSHIDILQKLGTRSTKSASKSKEAVANLSFDDSSGSPKDEERVSSSAPRWILLDVPRNQIDEESSQKNEGLETQVADMMRRLKSGLRTGLIPEEQHSLRPHFPDHCLLALRYSASEDERFAKSNRKIPMPPRLVMRNESNSELETHVGATLAVKDPPKDPLKDPPPVSAMPALCSLFCGGAPTAPPPPVRGGTRGSFNAPSEPQLVPARIPLPVDDHPPSTSTKPHQRSAAAQPSVAGKTTRSQPASAQGTAGGRGAEPSIRSAQHAHSKGMEPMSGYGGYVEAYGAHGGVGVDWTGDGRSAVQAPGASPWGNSGGCARKHADAAASMQARQVAPRRPQVALGSYDQPGCGGCYDSQVIGPWGDSRRGMPRVSDNPGCGSSSNLPEGVVPGGVGHWAGVDKGPRGVASAQARWPPQDVESIPCGCGGDVVGPWGGWGKGPPWPGKGRWPAQDAYSGLGSGVTNDFGASSIGLWEEYGDKEQAPLSQGEQLWRQQQQFEL